VPSVENESTFLTGDAFLVTRRVLERIGTFDPLFYGYFADIDFGIRACCAGFRLVLARGGFAYHLQDANIRYLPPDQQQAKVQRRFARVHENWARFKLKYGLPVEDPYASVSQLHWDRLNREEFLERHCVAPGDYSEYLVAGGP
jgi:GT2 family glycosyltransferase